MSESIMILDIKAMRMVPILKAMRLLELKMKGHSIETQRKLAKRYFEVLEKNNLLQNEDTQYYREHIDELFDQIARLTYTKKNGQIIHGCSFDDWGSDDFLYFCTDDENRIERIHIELIDKQLENERYCNPDYIFSKKREYVWYLSDQYYVYMKQFLNLIDKEIQKANALKR